MVHPPTPYLRVPWRLALLPAAFFLVQLPLVAWASRFLPAHDLQVMKAWPTLLFIVVFGVTHFFVTFLVYFQGENRRYFASSPSTALRFYVAPAAILVGFAAFYGLGLDARWALLGGLVALFVRGFDFFHLNRQSFGVLQFLKGPAAAKIPPWTKTAENVYFICWAVMLLLTFLGPNLTFDPTRPPVIAVGVILAGCLATVLTGYAMALAAGASRRDVGITAGYLALQTAAVIPGVIWTGFYPFSLSIHYVEYHLLMHPRWSAVPLDAGHPLDETLGWLRRRPWTVYGGLLALGGAWLWMTTAAAMPVPPAPRPLLHLLDGLFVFHYFVEMFLWKFSDPYFRKSLGPLYFPR